MIDKQWSVEQGQDSGNTQCSTYKKYHKKGKSGWETSNINEIMQEKWDVWWILGDIGEEKAFLYLSWGHGKK